MSSVRISQQHRSSAETLGSGDSGRADAAPGGASFALTLGAAALAQKASGAPLFAAATDADGAKGSRKRAGHDDKAGEQPGIMAVQDSLLAAVAGQVPLPQDVAGPHAGPVTTAPGDPPNAAAQPANAVSITIASASTPAAGTDAAGSIVPQAASSSVAGPPHAAEDTLTAVAASASPADVAGQAPDIAVNSGPQPHASPNANPAPPLPSALPGLGQALPAIAVSQPDAGTGNPATGGEGRSRFAPVVVASEGSRAAAAAALGAGQAPASANAPSIASPATIADASAAATISDQVTSHVVRLVTSNSRDMVLRLHPPELGEVTVRIAVNARDVSAWFGSPHPQVQTAITDAIGQLQTGLGNAGYNLSGAWVGADASDARQQAGSLPAPLPGTSAPTAAVDFGITAASRPSATGLNIYV